MYSIGMFAGCPSVFIRQFRSPSRAALALLIWAVLVRTIPAAEFGVVLMHGKWGSPKSMVPLAQELEAIGYLTSNPDMAWSGRRLYDIDYAAALEEVQKQVRQLRAGGARRIVVAGQSLGANAAVAYASSGFDLDGLIILSPGHFPERAMGKRVRPSLDRARSMIAANRGTELELFEDINQGRQRSIKVSANVYVSYFDPDGLGAITKNIRKLGKPVPLLLLIGTADPFYSESRAMFDSAPHHPLSRYISLDTDHAGVPSIGIPEVVKWLGAFTQ